MSNIPTMEWDELWMFYRRASRDVQKQILQQLDLPDLLKYASKKLEKEIMAEAPVMVTKSGEVVELVDDYLPVPVAQSSVTYERAAQSCFGPDWQKKLDAEARRRKEMKERRTHRGILSLLIRH